MKLAKIALLGAVIAVPVTAWAMGPGGDGEGWGRHGGGHGGGHGHGGGFSRMIETMQGLDTDRNGVISAEEFAGLHADRHSGLDTDGDGQVSMQEMEDFAIERMRERMANRFERLDGDGDGMISTAEFEAHNAAMFERFDRDDDGLLSIHDIPERGHGRGGDGWREGRGDGPMMPDDDAPAE